MEKVEVKENSNENTQAIAPPEVPPVSYKASDPMQEALKTISEEALQLSECLWQERKLIRELGTLLKLVLRQLNLSFNVPADVFPRIDKVQQVILSDEAHLILINDKNEVSSKALEDCSPATIFGLLSFIIPELGKKLASYRKEINSRISLFDKVNQELKNLQDAFASASENLNEATTPVNNGIKKALTENPDVSATNQGNKEST